MSFVTLEDLVAFEAEERARLCRTNPTRRPLSPDHEHVGLVGEWQFAREFKQAPNLLTHGDGGIDFTIPLGFTVDVKCYRKPNNLPVEVGKVRADIYVLAGYSDDTKRATLLGWEYGSVVARAPVRDLGLGVMNHCIPREQLRPMAELKARLMRLVMEQ